MLFFFFLSRIVEIKRNSENLFCLSTYLFIYLFIYFYPFIYKFVE